VRIRDNFLKFYNTLTTDETLLRYLYYAKDDPLNKSYPNLVNSEKYYSILKDRFKKTRTTDGLDKNAICRLCMYFGARTTTSNGKIANQTIIFDVYCHEEEYENNDLRSLLISDYITETLHDKNITGIGTVVSGNLGIITDSPNEYVGYRLVFTFGSGR
jgi:hypothetical protein